MSKHTKSVGEKMMTTLKRRARPCTTEELAAAAGIPAKDAYSRLWWLQKVDGLLKSSGHGKERRWQFTAAALRALEPEAQEQAQSEKA